MSKYQAALNTLRKTPMRFGQVLYDYSKEEIDLLQELVDKETPKKPIPFLNSFFKCGNCKGTFQNYHYQNRCPNCGQKLDWNE